MTSTLPLAPSFWSASAAFWPPRLLSVAMRETPMVGSVTMVSTRTTFVPASWMRLSGGAEAFTSFGATSIASGLVAPRRRASGSAAWRRTCRGPAR